MVAQTKSDAAKRRTIFMSILKKSLFLAFFTVCSALFLSQCDSDPIAPQEQFEIAEANVLKNGLKTSYRAISTGAYEINLSGEVDLVPGKKLNWTSSGNFGARPIDFELTADSDSVFYESQAETTAWVRPDFLDEAVIKGLFRMGIMHNLAVLSGGKLPDHSDSDSIDVWLSTDFSAYPQPSDTLIFNVLVNGNPTAKAELVLDDKNRPLYRWQHVEMGGGMTVEERFEYE